MSDTTPVSPAMSSTARPLNPVVVFEILGSKVRWPILQVLADGRPRTASDLAALLKRDFDGVSKHLRLMCATGVLGSRVGEDRRYLFFHIPEVYRQSPGVLDFGVCTVRLPSAPAPGKPVGQAANRLCETTRSDCRL